MSFDRIDPADLAALTPEERVAVEDLVLETVMREADAQEQASNPAAYRLKREHVDAVVAAIGVIPPEAEEAVRVAWREAARHILEREMAKAGPDPALATENDGEG